MAFRLVGLEDFWNALVILACGLLAGAAVHSVWGHWRARLLKVLKG